MFLTFITELNRVWRTFMFGESHKLSEKQLQKLDALFAEYPQHSWMSNLFPPPFPRYSNGVRRG